ncbi:MAG TPA: TM0106 family RecB-like putative nuclease, partial [Actinomycetales bacterium]|nr:TM0106 family RecB-like putative nuclease [Actinomycetales bacterium]
ASGTLPAAAPALPLAPTTALLLGSGERLEFPLADVMPVFRERRARLAQITNKHWDSGEPANWRDPAITACGSCEECSAAVEAHQDVLLVAGMRMDQRRKLAAAGITTIEQLAAATAHDRPERMARATFEKLRAQAALQWAQLQGGPEAPVRYELIETAADTLARLPAPSQGDLFFDFEGDPLYDEGDPTRTGLEYLWGIMGARGDYRAIWAHSSREERDAFVSFMDEVTTRRREFPDMHVYHYAPYETSALKRLAARYQLREKELDDLLRSEVFVDLYATVRGAIRVSAPSYSIKKLEPLYMGEHYRSDDDGSVSEGAGSVVAYHEFRALREDGDPDSAARLAALAEYNEYDCLSTLRLRDWLLERAAEAGVREQIVARDRAVEGEELSVEDPVFIALMQRAGPPARLERSAEEQAFAMLATALDFHRRESKSFWWEHYERLGNPITEWQDAKDVFLVERAEVVADWEVPTGGRARNARRMVRLVGAWNPGSTPGDRAQVVYEVPGPPRTFGPDAGAYVSGSSAKVEVDPDGPGVVYLTESRAPGDVFGELPVALVPEAPPRTEKLAEAIKEVGERASRSGQLPEGAVFDLLARRAPRVGGAGGAGGVAGAA